MLRFWAFLFYKFYISAGIKNLFALGNVVTDFK